MGGTGGAGSLNPGAAGDAIYSAGASASIGAITNSGQIIGNVEIDNQASVTVTGGTRTTFGAWTEGTITIGNGSLAFAGGNTALGDNVSVDGGNGTVTNMGALQLAAPQTITGNFTQTSAATRPSGKGTAFWGVEMQKMIKVFNAPMSSGDAGSSRTILRPLIRSRSDGIGAPRLKFSLQPAFRGARRMRRSIWMSQIGCFASPTARSDRYCGPDRLASAVGSAACGRSAPGKRTT